jgi:hypothetical protein
MKIWWDEVAWPWLQKNWWWLPVFPVVALVGAGMLLMKAISGNKTTIIDPTEKADQRAETEEAVRQAASEEEGKKLDEDLKDIRHEQAEQRTEFEQGFEKEVADLKSDPERLRDLMIEVGRGR